MIPHVLRLHFREKSSPPSSRQEEMPAVPKRHISCMRCCEDVHECIQTGITS